ncbi:MAG: hypothetical protein JXR91_05280 [Deltaproteobacteria bacterium]|nr:hypothetical protein [Deltaproteobacteria bacterium]
MKKITVFVLFLLAFNLAAEDKDVFSLDGDRTISPKGVQILETLSNGADEDAMYRFAQKISHEDLIKAMYSPVSQFQWTAIDMARYKKNPWPYLPYLAVLSAAPQRRVASTASNSLIRGIENGIKIYKSDSIVVDGEVKQLIELILKNVKNVYLDMDIRINSIQSLKMLMEISGNIQIFDKKLLQDESPEIRDWSLILLTAPFNKEELEIMEKAASDSSVLVKGHAAELLCENALSLGAEKLTDDLVELLEDLLKDSEYILNPAFLGCIARFKPEQRATFGDIIDQTENEHLKEYWKSLLE